MAVLTAGFNPSGATNGATIATTDAGDLTAWGSVSIGTGGAVTYDNTQTLFGKSLSGKLVSSSSGQADLQWTTAYTIGQAVVDFGRIYFRLLNFAAQP